MKEEKIKINRVWDRKVRFDLGENAYYCKKDGFLRKNEVWDER
jgi:hypothetical protein